jgi:hypothetical protein
MFGGIRTFEQITKDLEEAIALVQSQLGRQINSTFHRNAGVYQRKL